MTEEKEVLWKNKGETSACKCQCGSWKQHWTNFSEAQWPKKCSVKGCSKPAEVVAHVYRESSPEICFVVPLCKRHNTQAESFELKGNDLAVCEEDEIASMVRLIEPLKRVRDEKETEQLMQEKQVLDDCMKTASNERTRKVIRGMYDELFRRIQG